MDTETVIWIVIGVIALALVIGLVVWLMRRRGDAQAEHRRREAAELREKAAADDIEVRQREAELARADAEARAARAEAQARLAEADRLDAQTRKEAEDVDQSRRDVDERLHRADEIDPGPREHRTAAAGGGDDRHGAPGADDRERAPDASVDPHAGGDRRDRSAVRDTEPEHDPRV